MSKNGITIHLSFNCKCSRRLSVDEHNQQSMGLSACNLAENLDKLQDIEAGKFNIVYASAESAIDRRFLASLKKDSLFVRSLAACVVDESHTLETWTGLK